ncbi:unnamed protein product [Ophioblennius macclurei]
MPVETLHPQRKQARTAVVASPPRLRPKGPVGPDLYRKCVTAAAAAAAARPKQSAVERLEADKSKYVKSQVALSKQQPVRPAEVRKPPLNPTAALRPTRKTPAQVKVKQEGVQLDLKHLSNLICDVQEGAPPRAEAGGAPEAAAAESSDSSSGGTRQIKERPCPPPRPDWSSPAKVRLKSSDPVKAEGPCPSGSAAAGTVRRVDVMPQAGPVRSACRPPQFIRQPLQPIPLHSQSPLRPGTTNLRLFLTRTAPGSSPLKPVVVPSKPDASAPSPPAGSPDPPATLPLFPPPSPAITRLSSSSSRKRRSLTRSKSDMSDRYSRAGTDLERFFNLCGLDPSDLRELTPGASSDIVSLARFRSVSAPGSECAGSDRGEEGEEEEEEAADKARVPYGVSVIERNARVIKWLYGLRQAKDATKSTNL